MLRLARLLISHSPQPHEPVAGLLGDDLFTAAERRRGRPIGNQPSQFFADVHLHPLDHLRSLRTNCSEHASRDLDAIGVMVGGWLKAPPAR